MIFQRYGTKLPGKPVLEYKSLSLRVKILIIGQEQAINLSKHLGNTDRKASHYALRKIQALFLSWNQFKKYKILKLIFRILFS